MTLRSRNGVSLGGIERPRLLERRRQSRGRPTVPSQHRSRTAPAPRRARPAPAPSRRSSGPWTCCCYFGRSGQPGPRRHRDRHRARPDQGRRAPHPHRAAQPGPDHRRPEHPPLRARARRRRARPGVPGPHRPARDGRARAAPPGAPRPARPPRCRCAAATPACTSTRWCPSRSCGMEVSSASRTRCTPAARPRRSWPSSTRTSSRSTWPRHRLDRVTDRTITDAAKLRNELAAIRKRGYATSLGERQPGAASIAAPVFDHDGHVLAVLSACRPAGAVQAADRPSARRCCCRGRPDLRSARLRG